jgi:predicted HicB family RNase H-like nuclease
MSQTLTHEGYDGSVEYSAEDRILHGRILGIRDMVTFEGTDIASLERNFAAAVNEYLSFCKEQGKEPAQPFSGTFNVRTGVELHRRAALYAEAHSEKLNNVVKQALESFLEHAV